MSKEFIQKLAKIQLKLNAPKNQRNSFGNYNYRSCEDILEGVKPLLGDLFLSISDEIVQIGDRFYVKATATITDGESSHSASAMARESLTKKGMDDAQITGATSSYARKYCLNGLFGIDDAKDADTDEHARAATTPDKKSDARTPDDILADFTAQASDCQSVKELQGIYKSAWSALSQYPEHQPKCAEVYKTRGSELKKAA